MKITEIEHWALRVLEKVKNGEPVEDARVELKSDWIEPTKAARRLAGHANASRGEPILWLVGVNEKTGVVGVKYQELSNWFAGVRSAFDAGVYPALQDVNVTFDGRQQSWSQNCDMENDVWNEAPGSRAERAEKVGAKS